jgi:hypothetical protein
VLAANVLSAVESGEGLSAGWEMAVGIPGDGSAGIAGAAHPARKKKKTRKKHLGDIKKRDTGS